MHVLDSGAEEFVSDGAVARERPPPTPFHSARPVPARAVPEPALSPPAALLGSRSNSHQELQTVRSARSMPGRY